MGSSHINLITHTKHIGSQRETHREGKMFIVKKKVKYKNTKEGKQRTRLRRKRNAKKNKRADSCKKINRACYTLGRQKIYG